MEQRHLKLFLARFEVCPEHTVAQTGLPLQLSARVFSLQENDKVTTIPHTAGLTNLVELVEYFLISQHVGRDGHVHHWVGRPERHRENVHCQVDLVTFLGVLLPPTTAATEVTHVLLESHIDVPGQLHVLEHALQLAGEARTEERKFVKISGCCDC